MYAIRSYYAPQGRVFVHGEYWDAYSPEPIAEGDEVVVVRVEGTLRVDVSPVRQVVQDKDVTSSPG